MLLTSSDSFLSSSRSSRSGIAREAQNWLGCDLALALLRVGSSIRSKAARTTPLLSSGFIRERPIFCILARPRVSAVALPSNVRVLAVSWRTCFVGALSYLPGRRSRGVKDNRRRDSASPAACASRLGRPRSDSICTITSTNPDSAASSRIRSTWRDNCFVSVMIASSAFFAVRVAVGLVDHARMLPRTACDRRGLPSAPEQPTLLPEIHHHRPGLGCNGQHAGALNRRDALTAQESRMDFGPDRHGHRQARARHRTTTVRPRADSLSRLHDSAQTPLPCV